MPDSLISLAGPTRLELATAGVTGRFDAYFPPDFIDFFRHKRPL